MRDFLIELNVTGAILSVELLAEDQRAGVLLPLPPDFAPPFVPVLYSFQHGSL